MGPVERLIAFCAKHAWATVIVVFVLAALGLRAAINAPLDAIPDLSEPQVVILTEWEGQSPDRVEDQLTYPISSALLSAPGVRTVRGQSFFGASFVWVIFEEGTDIYWGRTRVTEALAQLTGRLPPDARPALGPDASGVGWVYQYALVDRSGKHDLAALTTIQEFDLKPALGALPGVAEVGTLGGHGTAYELRLDPIRLRAYQVSLNQVIQAVRASNIDADGGVIELAGHEHMVRGFGSLRGLEDLGEVPVATDRAGVPILLKQLGELTLGPTARRGIIDLDGEGEVVGGVVIMRQGGDVLSVIEATKARLEQLKPGLPAGVEVVTTYDRAPLVTEAIGTLRRTLVEEMVVVALVIGFFLMHARSAMVAVITLPVAVLLAFIPISALGLGLDIMSLGGIAVAIGAMVDATIVLLDNVHERLAHAPDAPEARRAAVLHGMQEVGPSIFFSLLVLTAAFMPIFGLSATEGRLFRPLAATKTFAMASGAVLAITFTPALVVLLVRGGVRHADEHPFQRFLVWIYSPVVRLVVRARYLVVALAFAAVLATLPIALSLPSEFMPPLEEGTLLYMPTAPPGMSATEAARVLQLLDAQLAAVPEVSRAFGKSGRAQTATDPAPIDMFEITLTMVPKSEWRPGLDWEGLITLLDQTVSIPGMPNVWWMPIQTRTEMLNTGVRSPIAVAVLGPDHAQIADAAVQIERALRSEPGLRSVSAERMAGGFSLDVELDRPAAARYGLNAADLAETMRVAIGGMPLTTLISGRERHPVLVRYAPSERDTPGAIRDVLMDGKGGAQIPLSDITTQTIRRAPAMIRSEASRVQSYVFIDPGETPLSEAAATIEAKLATLTLPAGTRTQLVGQLEHLERANQRLAALIPLTLLIVIALLYLNTGSGVETAIVLMAVPFSLIGAFWLLWALGYSLSVAVWVGLIALAGLDAETGVVMLLYLSLAHKDAEAQGKLRDKPELEEAIVHGAARRIRPKLMTVLTTMIGLTPILWSTGTGADLMKRVAAPMVGGLVTSFLLELTVFPALFAIWRGWSLPRHHSEPQDA